MLRWFANKYTEEETQRWILLRSIEWPSYPNFLAPLWGIFIVYYFGWLVYIVTLIVITFIWKFYIMNNYVSIRLMEVMGLWVNLLKWPLAVIFAIVSFESHRNIIFTLFLLIFPFITYMCSYLEFPYKRGGIDKNLARMLKMQNMIRSKLGIEKLTKLEEILNK